MPEFAEPADGLQPPEDLLDEFALLLANRVAGMPRGPIIDRAAAGFLGDVRRDAQRADTRDKAADVKPLVAGDGGGVAASASNSKAASRSAVPVAAVTHTLATNPCRLSSRTCPA